MKALINIVMSTTNNFLRTTERWLNLKPVHRRLKTQEFKQSGRNVSVDDAHIEATVLPRCRSRARGGGGGQ